MVARRMLARRVVGRAVVRTAVVGGVAYGVGHHMATKSAQQQQLDAQQDAQLADLQQQQQTMQQPVYQQAASPPPPAAQPAPSGGLTDEAIARLKQLGELHQAGTLTDPEFETAKRKILGL
ncbi:MAG: SHOCT domain-containing protein [Ktedonobacteraceae bacterium]|jgi:transcription initiation factor TFIID subunit TAF12